METCPALSRYLYITYSSQMNGCNVCVPKKKFKNAMLLVLTEETA